MQIFTWSFLDMQVNFFNEMCNFQPLLLKYSFCHFFSLMSLLEFQNIYLMAFQVIATFSLYFFFVFFRMNNLNILQSRFLILSYSNSNMNFYYRVFILFLFNLYLCISVQLAVNISTAIFTTFCFFGKPLIYPNWYYCLRQL